MKQLEIAEKTILDRRRLSLHLVSSPSQLASALGLSMRPSPRIFFVMSTKRSIQSYARPTQLLDIPKPFCPAVPFLPLQSPPQTEAPTIPDRPSVTAPEGWIRSSHALRAAHPRTFRETSGTLVREDEPFTEGKVPSDETKEARTKRATEELKRVTKARYYATRVKQEEKVDTPGLWIAAERWQREGGKGDGLVLVCTHANGFHKEVSRLTELHMVSMKEITGEVSTSRC